MVDVIVRNGTVLIKTESEEAAEDLSSTLVRFGISHQIVCADGFYNAVRFDVTESRTNGQG